MCTCVDKNNAVKGCVFFSRMFYLHFMFRDFEKVGFPRKKIFSVCLFVNLASFGARFDVHIVKSLFSGVFVALKLVWGTRLLKVMAIP